MFGRDRHLKTDEPWRGGVYLTTAKTSLEADIIESKLTGAGIPSLKRYEGAANFIEITMGFNSAFPIEIYVPEEKLEEAREVIVPVPIDDDFEDFEGDFEEKEAGFADAESENAGEEAGFADAEAENADA